MNLPRPSKPHQSGRQPSIHPFTFSDYESTWQEIQRIYPAVSQAGLDTQRSFNGIFSFTPDGGPLLEPSQIIEGVWLAQAVWVTASAGAARVMAEWISTGHPAIRASIRPNWMSRGLTANFSHPNSRVKMPRIL